MKSETKSSSKKVDISQSNAFKCGLAPRIIVKQSFIIEKHESWENAVERCIK